LRADRDERDRHGLRSEIHRCAEGNPVTATLDGGPSFPYGPFRVENWKFLPTANLLFLSVMAALFVGIAAWGWLVLHEVAKAEELLAVGAVVNSFGVPYILWLATPVQEFRVGEEGIEVRFEGPVRKKAQFVPWRLISVMDRWEQPKVSVPVGGTLPGNQNSRLTIYLKDPGLPLPRRVGFLVPREATELVRSLSERASQAGNQSGPADRIR
jgi:hypothetical protein